MTKTLDSTAVYAYTTLISMFICVPIALAMEGPALAAGANVSGWVSLCAGSMQHTGPRRKRSASPRRSRCASRALWAPACVLELCLAARLWSRQRASAAASARSAPCAAPLRRRLRARSPLFAPQAAIAAVGAQRFWLDLFGVGMLYHLYNQFAFNTLQRVSPVSHGVCNVVKRVVIIFSSVLFFNQVRRGRLPSSAAWSLSSCSC